MCVSSQDFAQGTPCTAGSRSFPNPAGGMPVVLASVKLAAIIAAVSTAKDSMDWDSRGKGRLGYGFYIHFTEM